MMSAVAAAAGGKIVLEVLALCQQRRDDRKAEGCEQQDGEKATHRCIQCNGFERQGLSGKRYPMRMQRPEALVIRNLSV